ncbi:MAG: EF2563 family selenium-dependent molybdenum hydroxylase system protein [Methylocystaceae bacterium]|nr:EF2563 family selenium-dependent molybdenum hydroxylase system protein [Methylocystaceae bacterium]
MKVETKRYHNPVALVRGVGDVGSAIAWRLFKAGFSVISHENRQPRTIRRKMSFCDALWDGEAVLEGVQAVRVERMEDVLPIAQSQKGIALYAGPYGALVQTVCPDIIVDGRIQKFAKVENMTEQAPLTIAVGPSFVAGQDVDFVIESCWGDNLGQVIAQGCASEPVSVPPEINGVGWERFVRAGQAGRFESERDIGQHVNKGDVIGLLDEKTILAPITGYLRGLLHSGLSVVKDEKVCEIDPRESDAHFVGLAERPNEISKGVMHAIKVFSATAEDAFFIKDIINQCAPGKFRNMSKMC